MGRLDMLFLGGCATRLGNDVGSPDLWADWICCFSVAATRLGNDVGSPDIRADWICCFLVAVQQG